MSMPRHRDPGLCHIETWSDRATQDAGRAGLVGACPWLTGRTRAVLGLLNIKVGCSLRLLVAHAAADSPPVRPMAVVICREFHPSLTRSTARSSSRCSKSLLPVRCRPRSVQSVLERPIATLGASIPVQMREPSCGTSQVDSCRQLRQVPGLLRSNATAGR